MQIVKIPTERIKVLLGEGGQTEKMLERQGGITIEADVDGNVSITAEDPIVEWKAVDVIKAIGRGFAPLVASKLFNEEYVLKVISLREMFSKEKQRLRYKARVIGTKGKAKATIEEFSGALLCIYGNTVSILGKLEEVALAGRAVGLLLEGASHGVVYFVLRKERQKMQEAGLL